MVFIYNNRKQTASDRKESEVQVWEEYVSLPTAIFGKWDFFILRASGQSMIEAGIDDGALASLSDMFWDDD